MPLPAEILPVTYVDGTFVASHRATISAFDRGFLVADGIFETFHVVEGVPLSLGLHLERLARSAAFMRLAPPGRDALEAAIGGLITRNGLDPAGSPEAALRLTISRGASLRGPPTVTAYLRALGAAHVAKRTEGVLAFRLPFARHAVRDLAQHKTLSYLASSLGQVWLAERTDDPRAEGLFVTVDGRVLEGASSNVFAVHGDVVSTTPISAGLLPGTSRRVALKLAAAAGLQVREQALTLEQLGSADEAFVTSSTLPLAPLVQLEGVPIGGGRRGPIVRRLQEAFAARVREEVATYRSARRPGAPGAS